MTNDIKEKYVTIGRRGERFTPPPEEETAYFTALGRAIVLWGKFETQLDNYFLILRRANGADAILPFDPPFNLQGKNGKNKLIRKCLRKVPGLKSIEEPLLGLLDDVVEAAQIRHIIVHGRWSGFQDREILTGTFTKPKEGNDITRQKWHYIDLPSLEGMETKFNDLCVRLSSITSMTLSLLPPPRMEKLD